MQKKNMVRSIHYNIGLWVLLLVVGCKTAQQVQNNDQYFTISFYSKGAGIDHEAKNLVDNTIANYRKKGHEINYSSNRWGREGEIDYCFALQSLEATIYKAFWNELSISLQDRQVHITEKVPCKTHQ